MGLGDQQATVMPLEVRASEVDHCARPVAIQAVLPVAP